MTLPQSRFSPHDTPSLIFLIRPLLTNTGDVNWIANGLLQRNQVANTFVVPLSSLRLQLGNVSGRIPFKMSCNETSQHCVPGVKVKGLVANLLKGCLQGHGALENGLPTPIRQSHVWGLRADAMSRIDEDQLPDSEQCPCCHTRTDQIPYVLVIVGCRGEQG